MVAPTPKAPPQRMSMPKPEDRKPSTLIAVFWWVVFIVPVAFVYFTTDSLLLVFFLVLIRVAMIYVPRLRKTKEPVAQEPQQTVNTNDNVLSPYIEEAKAEWWGLLKFIRVYDKEKEEKNLETYRKLRGWE